MTTAIVDYGMGNLGSVTRALAELGADAFIAENPGQLPMADRLILPGVGSFVDGMANLAEHNWVEPIREHVRAGKPVLGICLGMQLLASSGSEGGEHAGLDLIPGKVNRLDILGCSQRIPHVGWNNVRLAAETSGLFAGIPNGTDFYFVHSFAFQATDTCNVLADVEYGIPFPAAIARDNVFGTQFHPEKSSKAGFRLLKNFLEL